ncbi:hypothetical protein ACLOJK_006435, partial [Asimina triloba]
VKDQTCQGLVDRSGHRKVVHVVEVDEDLVDEVVDLVVGVVQIQVQVQFGWVRVGWGQGG